MLKETPRNEGGDPVPHDDGMLGGLPDTVLVISAAFFNQTLFSFVLPGLRVWPHQSLQGNASASASITNAFPE